MPDNFEALQAALARLAEYCASYAQMDAGEAEKDAGALLALIRPALDYANGDDFIAE